MVQVLPAPRDGECRVRLHHDQDQRLRVGERAPVKERQCEQHGPDALCCVEHLQ